MRRQSINGAAVVLVGVLAVIVYVAYTLGELPFIPQAESVPIDTPAPLRAQVQRDFPEFEIVGASGESQDGADRPGVTLEQVTFTLRHKPSGFHLEEVYGRSFRSGTPPAGPWNRNAVEDETSFTGVLDERTLRLIDLVNTRVTPGKYVFRQYTGGAHEDPPFVDCALRPLETETDEDVRAELYTYDASKGEWSFQP